MPDERSQHVEPLDGGLVNSRDPSLLQPGELTQADNAMYLPDARGPHFAPSRVEFSPTIGGSVTGLRYAPFDFVELKVALVANQITVNAKSGYNFNQVSLAARVLGKGVGDFNTVATKPSSTQITLATAATITEDVTLTFEADRVLVAQANGKYKIAKVGATGTFADVATITEGDTLETVRFGNRHVLMNGKEENLVLKPDGTTIPHGLKPVTAAAAVATAAGSWGLPVGYYAYWTTEYDAVNDVESDYQGPRPTAVNISTITTKATITRPNQVNPTATHWRVYRSVRLASTTAADAAKEDVFPSGFLIGEAEIKSDGTQQTMDDGGTTSSTAARNPSALGPYQVWVNDGTANPPTNALGSGTSTYASVTGPGGGIYVGYPLDLGTFGFTVSTLTPPITGITLSVKGKVDAGGFLTAALPQRNTAEKTIPLTTLDSTKTVGSADDDWLPTGQSWNPADFADGTFFVRLYGYVADVAHKVYVDTVSVIISYGSGQQSGTIKAFPAVVVKPFGITTQVGRNGPPPKSTTGTLFRGSLLVDDVAAEGYVAYSAPGFFHSFPSPYRIPVEADGNLSKIKNIKRVGNVAVVGTQDYLSRFNTLPLDIDSSFDGGAVQVPFELNHGIAGTHSAAVFSMVEGAQVLAYVSQYGVHRTDGYRTDFLTPDLNWTKLVHATNVHRSLFVNNPRYYELILLYVPLGSGTPTVPTKAIRFSYHPQHLKNGYLKISGPCDVTGVSAVQATLRDGTKHVYVGKSDGTVQLENQGFGTTMTLRTRDMYLDGVGHEWRGDEEFIRYTLRGFSASSPGSIAVTHTLQKYDSAPRVGTTKTATIIAFPSDGAAYPERAILTKVDPNEAAEAASTQLAITSTQPIILDYLTLYTVKLGRQNSK